MNKIILLLLIIFIFFGCSVEEAKVLQYEQKVNFLNYKASTFDANMDSFNSRYFMPWHINNIKINVKIASLANKVYIKKDKYYVENKRIWPESEVKKIINSTNFELYNSVKLYAITTTNTQVRNLPTLKPFTKNWATAGEGLAFDYMQNTHLHVNTPIFVSHYNNDDSWAFIQSPASAGWIQINKLKILDAKQRNKFEKAKKIVILKDNLPIYSSKQEFLLYTKIGAIFAYDGKEKNFYNSYIFTRFAGLISIKIQKRSSNLLPIKFNKQNIENLSKQIIGEKNGIEGRYVIGKAVISDLHLGENLKNIKKDALLLSKVEGIVIKPNVKQIYTNNFVKAYPSVVKYSNNQLIFNDNSVLSYHDFVNKSYEQKISNPSIKDTLSLKYKAYEPIKPLELNDDAGRFRNEKLFKKLYGQNKNEITNNLVKLKWIDGSEILFNKKENAALQLQKVINELKTLPNKYHKYLKNIAGTFTYRNIANTKRLSMHSFGIAIDLNVKYSNYWAWNKIYKYKNKIPKKVVNIFEKYGFIWGGRWYHYDTMHFEYRPELFTNLD